VGGRTWVWAPDLAHHLWIGERLHQVVLPQNADGAEHGFGFADERIAFTQRFELGEIALRVFEHRNLHMVDVVAVPERLEDGIGEAKDHDVLHGLFAQVVVEAVDLPLLENVGKLAG